MFMRPTRGTPTIALVKVNDAHFSKLRAHDYLLDICTNWVAA